MARTLMMSRRMRGWIVVVGLVIASSNSSHAEVSALASASYGQARMGDSYDDFASSFMVHGDVGYRISDVAHLGGHIGVGSKAAYVVAWPASMFNESWDYDYRPIDLGISLQLAVRSNIALTPWLGVQNGLRQQECYRLEYNHNPDRTDIMDCTPKGWELDMSMRVAGGVSLAVDAWKFDDNSRLSIVGSVTAARGRSEEVEVEPYRAIWLGLGYRFGK